MSEPKPACGVPCCGQVAGLSYPAPFAGPCNGVCIGPCVNWPCEQFVCDRKRVGFGSKPSDKDRKRRDLAKDKNLLHLTSSPKGPTGEQQQPWTQGRLHEDMGGSQPPGHLAKVPMVKQR
ncbi:unnamed protein product [Pieris macdunnoughi]|uniref:Uncharacterized protein n=1 Tax=Pieris macdunnoughi TaxID=345717 RepID=A0A821WDZ5_9NEOP|nr:unnamed protein product [Pieris macdunnoughi]